MMSGILCNKRNATMVLFFNILFMWPGEGWAFYMPTGIPQAWIAPDIPAPSAPSPWTTQQTGFYYVDNSVTCSDANTYGWPATPRCKFPTSLAAGSYVEIHGGPYNWTSTAYIRSYGTASKPVWIIGAAGNSIMMGLVLHGTYMYVDGLIISGDKGISIRPYSSVQTDHIMVRNTTITGSGSLAIGTTGIYAEGGSATPFVGMIAYKNTISYMGDSEASVENDRHALATGSYISDVWFLDNLTHHNGGDGVQFSHGGIAANHFYYGRNTSHDERENCVDVKIADDVVISDNICYGIEHSSSSPGEGMVVHYNPDRISFINNIVHDCDHGIVSTGSNVLSITGNLIYNINEYSGEEHSDISSYRTGSAIMLNGTRNVFVSNNTIYNSVLGVLVEAPSDTIVPYFEITGNIISNLKIGDYTSLPSHSVIIKGDAESVTASVIEHNLFYSPFDVYVGATHYTSLATLQSISKCDDGIGCIDADPQFLNAPNNFSLQNSSPAKDAGYLSDVYTTFQELYSIDINKDIAGTVRPQNTFWDIGAYEFSNQSIVPKIMNIVIP